VFDLSPERRAIRDRGPETPGARSPSHPHGAERVDFGLDWPMTSPKEEIAAIEALGLSDDETKQVLGGTAVRVLRLHSQWV